MGAEEVNARGGVLGGRKIELVIEDDSGTPEKGSAGFRKLASQDQAVAVVGQFHSSVMTAVQVLAEQFGMHEAAMKQQQRFTLAVHGVVVIHTVGRNVAALHELRNLGHRRTLRG